MARSRAIGIDCGSTTARVVARSGISLSAARTGRAVGDCRSQRVHLGRRRLARRVDRRASVLRNACRHVHARRNLGGGDAPIAGTGRAGNHRRGVDAGRGISGAIRLELRRRESVCPHASLRHAGRFSPLRRRGPSLRDRCRSSTWFTTISAPSASDCCGHLPRPISRAAIKTNGARRSISTANNPSPVREFFLANVRHWIGEYHLDGLRIDATQAFHDRIGEPHPARIGPRSTHRRPESAR